MPIRLKIFTLLTLISIVPLAVIGFFMFQRTQAELEERVVAQLEGLALVQEQRVNEALNRYLEQVKLVTSRTQLRVSLSEHLQTGSASDHERVVAIIRDAKDSVSGIREISIFDFSQQIVASTNSQRAEQEPIGDSSFEGVQPAHRLSEIFKDKDNVLRVRLLGPLVLDGELIGIAEIVASADPIIAITEDYTGLGETGEVLIARRNQAGDALFLTPLRFDAGAALNRAVPMNRSDVPMIPAVLGVEQTFTERGVVDYRGEEVFAVTRSIDPLDWGLVVKIDRKEALAPVSQLTRTFLFILLFMAAAVTIVSLLLARTVTEPIRQLTLFAQNLQSGNFSLRTEVRGKNEIGFLAKTLNLLATRLSELYKGLEDKVRERTAQLEEAKAKDEAMLRAIGDGLVFLDNEKKIVFVNRAAQQVLGWQQSELIGKKWIEIARVKDHNQKPVSPEKLPMSKVSDHRKKTARSSLSSSELYYTKKDGTVFPVGITASAVRAKHQEIGVIVVFRDISLEREVDKAKTEFVSLASHQLRTPLSSINWYTEMLLEGDAGTLSEEQKNYLEEIYRGNQRMVELVNSLLNVSRIELGTFIIEPEETDIAELVQSVVKEQKPQIDSRQIQVAAEFDRSLPKVSVDKKLTRIIVQNLLSNAVKYTPKQGRVSIDLRKKGEDLLLTVVDAGYGIPEAQKDKIFTKLFRADNVREKDTEGTGLGLYIVKSILDHSGGKIWFESTENKGTTFYVQIPLSGMRKKTGAKQLG